MSLYLLITRSVFFPWTRSPMAWRVASEYLITVCCMIIVETGQCVGSPAYSRCRLCTCMSSTQNLSLRGVLLIYRSLRLGFLDQNYFGDFCICIRSFHSWTMLQSSDQSGGNICLSHLRIFTRVLSYWDADPAWRCSTG